MSMKIHLSMLGCRLNQAEIDSMARQFQQQGHEVVHDPTQAEQFIVNTCTVTHEASKTSRKLIRELHRANPHAQTTVTGCYAQVAPDDVMKLPGVVRVVDNTGKDNIVQTITGVTVKDFDHEPIARDTTIPGRTRAFVKVQDGCDNACTFCITTVARGAGRSRTIDEVVAEIRQLHQMGYQETVLTGVHLGSYGRDLGQNLKQLVQTILQQTEIPRLRLSSLEPWDLTEDFFELWQNPRLCPHLHLPLQSGCDTTLKRMRRNTTQDEFTALVATARAHIPNLLITTDVIAGFPGETDEEFAISCAFIEQMAFSGMHIFRYSKRAGTPAARMKGQVPEAIKKQRSKVLHRMAAHMQQRAANLFKGQALSVLWEHVTGATQDGFINVGYTDNYLRVWALHPRVLTNHITQATLGEYDPDKNQIQAYPIIE
ncbi:MAG: tRNA (N(6)-L-threonylcarbamoyladenosine(37)-C(2))-methylthiotransferase MtaB [Chloroflexi bacterium]|nr:MAG: tRNA (N(6)-L-threonylcarbamoyladenosine(37)-C(2))-methylthiotransferase MtaB [Chloroflexota bacterium]